MARPVGIKNGREPEGGYPELPAALGAFIAGFIEGEGSFAIRKQTRGYGFQPLFTLAVRADDGDLVRALCTGTRIGRISDKRAHRTSNPQVVWNVSAKSDCRRLVELLDQHPLHGHKAAAYDAWRSAVVSWVGSNPKARMTPLDWEPFPAWKDALETANRYRDPWATAPPRLASERHWPAFLAGFITAEAHFFIERRGRPGFRINLRADDLQLLSELRRLTGGLGRIYGPYSRGTEGNPVVYWGVVSVRDVTRLVQLLDVHMPGGRKGVEFCFWKQAVWERSMGNPRDDGRVVLIRSRLIDLRRFRLVGLS